MAIAQELQLPRIPENYLVLGTCRAYRLTSALTLTVLPCFTGETGAQGCGAGSSLPPLKSLRLPWDSKSMTALPLLRPE